MADEQTNDTPTPDPTEMLRQQLAQANSRLIQAELRSHAVQAGIIDMDCLQFLDPTSLQLAEDGTLPNAAAAVAKLKRDKPWVFARASSSVTSKTPAPEAPKTRMAKEMSYEEWQTARSRLISGK